MKPIYKLNKLFGDVAENNKASIKVLEKNGFVLEEEGCKIFFIRVNFIIN